MAFSVPNQAGFSENDWISLLLPVGIVDEWRAEGRRSGGINVDAAVVLEADHLVEEGDELGDGDGHDEVGHMVGAALGDDLHPAPVGATIQFALGWLENLPGWIGINTSKMYFSLPTVSVSISPHCIQ